MLEFITLYFADKYISLSRSEKRAKYFRLNRIEDILNKPLFGLAVALSIILCLPWDIHEIIDGNKVYGIIDILLECVGYPIIIHLECVLLWQNKMDYALLMLVTIIAMTCHTPTYSLMLVWVLVFIVVRFQLSGLSKLQGYPQFREADETAMKTNVDFDELVKQTAEPTEDDENVHTAPREAVMDELSLADMSENIYRED